MRVSRKLRIAYFAHSLRSDWNNGNAHFLRGLMRALGAMGHAVIVFEPHQGWSLENLMSEPCGEEALRRFAEAYPDLRISEYDTATLQKRIDGVRCWRASTLSWSMSGIPLSWRTPCLKCARMWDTGCFFTIRIIGLRPHQNRFSCSGWIVSMVLWHLARYCEASTGSDSE